MNQTQWAAPPRNQAGAGAGAGSVRRARERMESGAGPEAWTAPKPLSSPNPVRLNPNSPGTRPRPQLPYALQDTIKGAGSAGVMISRPTPAVAQWPLPTTMEGPIDQTYQPPAGRSIPPRRPPRPSQVPAAFDPSKLSEHSAASQYQPQSAEPRRERHAEEEEEMSPTTHSSRPSTTSSVGSIPDFPMPMHPQLAGASRRSGNPGPPQIARRGVSSYYSQASFISPIPEEGPRTQASHGSYASSAAIPSSWGSNSPRSPFSDDEETRERGFGNETLEESRESEGDEEGRGLIRSASVGKRAKPSMITTKSAEKMEPARPAPQPHQKSKLERMGVITGGVAVAGGATGLVASKTVGGSPIVGNPTSPLASGTGFIESNSSSEETVPRLPRAVDVKAESPVKGGMTPIAGSPVDRRASILSAHHAASALPGGPPRRTSTLGSRLSMMRRPPRLDIGAVREAESRGSMTSLPDLIRRATKLAAMMDRGKRPASRGNDLTDFPDLRERNMGVMDEKRGSNFSGMIAAFPPPGLVTPLPTSDSPRVHSWPATGPLSARGLRTPLSSRPRRRCCGMPCWAFLSLILVLLIIISAAIFIPLQLLVFSKASPREAAATAFQACEQSPTTACRNGGTAFLAPANSSSSDPASPTSSFAPASTCSCICINGFTGPTCTIAGAAGCTTTSVSSPSDFLSSPTSTFTNVTLGTAIPRLIQAAQANFSIPLVEPLILARFNAANLSCVSENALVTFQGESGGEAVGIVKRLEALLVQEVWHVKRQNRDGFSFSSSSSRTVGGVQASPPPAAISSNGGDNTRIPAVATPAPAPAPPPPPPPAATTPSPAPAPAPAALPSGSPLPSAPASSAPFPSSASSSSSSSAPSSQPTPSPPSDPAAPFTISATTLDFARIATLFVLQQSNFDAAVVAQGSLARFFAGVSGGTGGGVGVGGSGNGNGNTGAVVSNGVASNVSLGVVRGTTVGWVDLVRGRVGLANGTVWGD